MEGCPVAEPPGWSSFGDGSACTSDTDSAKCYLYGNDLSSATPHPCAATELLATRCTAFATGISLSCGSSPCDDNFGSKIYNAFNLHVLCCIS